MIQITCPQCTFIFLARGNKKLIKGQHRHKFSNFWACPACNTKHYDVFADICPTCKINFNSKEFDDICREKGLIK